MDSKQLQPIICPSLLAADMALLGPDAKKVLDFGAEWLHVDVMDFHFVPNLSFGVPTITSLRKYLGPAPILDCHLMIDTPTKWLETLKKAGASRFTLHTESLENIQETIDQVKKLGLPLGLAVKPKTPIADVFPYVEHLDLVLVMTVEPGFGGQSFMEDQMDKVRQLRKLYPNLNIQVDGGLTVETTKIAAAAGANVIVAGSSVFNSSDPKKTIGELKSIVRKALGLPEPAPAPTATLVIIDEGCCAGSSCDAPSAWCSKSVFIVAAVVAVGAAGWFVFKKNG